MRVRSLSPMIGFLEAAANTKGIGSDTRVKKLVEICEKFKGYLQDATKALKEKEENDVEEHGLYVEEMDDRIAEKIKSIGESENKMTKTGKKEY